MAELDGGSIFITGGTGFFGRWLLALLVRARAGGVACEVTLLTRSPDRFAAECPEFAALPWLRLCEGDVRFFESPKGRFSHVIHAATETSASADSRPAQLISTIVDGTRRVLEFAALAGVRRLLYVSSGAVYGAQPADLPLLPETHPGAGDPLDPRTAYGQARRLAEHLCIVAAASGPFEAVIARAFAVVGPGLPLDGHFAIGNFIADALAGREIKVKGDGTALRSYPTPPILPHGFWRFSPRGKAARPIMSARTRKFLLAISPVSSRAGWTLRASVLRGGQGARIFGRAICHA